MLFFIIYLSKFGYGLVSAYFVTNLLKSSKLKSSLKSNLVLLGLSFRMGDTQDDRKNKMSNFFIIDR